MKYYTTIDHHSRANSSWEEIKANSLTSAKRAATKKYCTDFVGHTIKLVECETGEEEKINDLPAWTKINRIGTWEAPKW